MADQIVPSLERLQWSFKACTFSAGWTWPIGWGTGVFLPVGILPYPADLNTVVGAPIDVPRFEGECISGTGHGTPSVARAS